MFQNENFNQATFNLRLEEDEEVKHSTLTSRRLHHKERREGPKCTRTEAESRTMQMNIQISSTKKKLWLRRGWLWISADFDLTTQQTFRVNTEERDASGRFTQR